MILDTNSINRPTSSWASPLNSTLLAKDPAERPESATDVWSALDAIDLAAIVEQPAAAADEAHALDSLAGGVFVGRQREMGELKACLEDALSGRGRLVTLVGEPGIGKTRTAQELATYAGLRGAQVLWGRCYEEQGVPPYWPWGWWTQSANCWGIPMETSWPPSTPTVTRVSRASRTARRSSGVAESCRHKYAP